MPVGALARTVPMRTLPHMHHEIVKFTTCPTSYLWFLIAVRTAAGIISYAGGHITILNREALEMSSCECCRTAKDQSHFILGRLNGKQPRAESLFD